MYLHMIFIKYSRQNNFGKYHLDINKDKKKVKHDSKQKKKTLQEEVNIKSPRSSLKRSEQLNYCTE